MNASGSHHQLRKLDIRLRAFIGATHTRGGVYMYSNHQGCDGGRLYYGMLILAYVYVRAPYYFLDCSCGLSSRSSFQNYCIELIAM